MRRPKDKRHRPDDKAERVRPLAERALTRDVYEDLLDRQDEEGN